MDKHSLPIEFEQVMNVLDDRFMKVKIWIAHTGENRNNSIFSKEVLEAMIPSLANVPILGYIAVDEDNQADFKGHEEALVIEDKKLKLKYLGRAYGVIPTENNARFETRYGSDGVEREYLVCDGIVWRKFPEVEEIFDRDGGFKWQSMELQNSSVKGYINDNGVFVFTEAKFEGACILGEHVTPAMVSSTIEKFSVNTIKQELGEMLTEFNAYFSNITVKGDDIVKDNITQTQSTENPENTAFTEENPVIENPVVEDVTPATGEDNTEFAKKDKKKEEDDKDAKTADASKTDTSKEDPKEDPAKNEDEEDEKDKKKPKKFSVMFELSHDDIRSGIYQALRNHDSFKDSWTWVSKVYDNHAIIESEDEGKFYKINYVKHENAVSLGEFEELFPMFLTQSEKSVVDSTRNNFEALEQEAKELREFKAGVELAEKEQKLSQYSATLAKEDFDTIKANLSNFSMEEMEKEIGFVLLKKNHFSANTQEDSTQARVGVINAVDANPYGSASIYFSK
ncbi:MULTISPECIES: hypothetical protein [Bacillus cereus group]|uniref:hypothetical protein n=1 Tax=Bacillus cereus group TaxID=86661 RepID=UPI00202CD83E|nr:MULTISPECIES: hypothetical protein [Bacillus cereus group]MCM0006260.1 hypothetical protein [Bacillus paranthracis]MDX5884883.1 hypothetical protein [Bacillus cereus group sp. BfR-BA-00999]MDX6046803.1 hypothetical protein [Bacillus paranthracis]